MLGFGIKESNELQLYASENVRKAGVAFCNLLIYFVSREVHDSHPFITFFISVASVFFKLHTVDTSIDLVS